MGHTEVTFDDALIVSSHQKFGLKATVRSEGLEEIQAKRLLERALQVKEKGLPMVDRLLIAPRVEQLVRQGDVTIDDRYRYFLEMI